MGDAVLSAFLQVLFQFIADFVKTKLQFRSGLENEWTSLKTDAKIIQAVLRGAEKMQHSDPQEQWFSALKDVSYDAMDLLDEYFYEFQRRQVIHFPSVRNSPSISQCNPKRQMFMRDMEEKIKKIANRITHLKETGLAFQIDIQGHTEQHHESRWLNQSSAFPPTFAYGRHHDQEKIVNMLLQSDLKPKIAVLPILGEGCMGKTTVTQLVFSDDRVTRHFDLKLWVHVSPQFDIGRITASIIESIEGRPFSGNLHTLQTRLVEHLQGTRYLLVLDDYWRESWRDWHEKLKLPLMMGAVGSKIIVTTRSAEVARVLGTSDPYLLQRLQDEDCWWLFCHISQGTEIHTYNSQDFPSDSFFRLKEEVLRKCKGVPFIAVCLGHRVRQEIDRSNWEAILREENWDSSDHLIGALRLSYAQLDSHLKPCFAYISIVPQNFWFEEEWLIQNWMAQGFIQPNPRTKETIEDTGRSYFRSLVARSFFQRAHVDRTGERHNYSLSKLMLDLAIDISGEYCKCHTIEGPYNIPEKVRYLTVFFNTPASQFNMISGGQRLHTLLVVGGFEDFVLKIPNDIGKRFKRLRALDLSNVCLAELPESIGELKHLRCLQLRSAKIRRLPKSICDLYNLQTLGLTNCYYLEVLPHKIKNLHMLRHIDLVMSCNSCHNVCRLRCMPKDIGLLTDLQTLSRFVVSHRSALRIDTNRGGIAELAKLDNLRGELLISNLHLVEDIQEAVLANLTSKQLLQKLELSWSSDNKNADKILEHLKPPTNIKELTISGYSGMTCPRWLSSAEYTNLVTVCLYDFRSCSVLPPLGLLPLLENLHLKGWQSLVSIDCSRFCGRSMASFQSLKKLHLERMDKLELWDGDKRCAFPNLLELVLENCCKLEQVTHNLPLLAKLTVEGSPGFQGLWNFPSLKYLNVSASGEWILRSWHSLFSPISITLSKLSTMHLPSGLGVFHTSLQRLEISHCEQLQHIPEDWPPCNLTHFSIRHCPQLCELPWGIERLQALEDMEIVNCGQITYLPEMIRLRSLVRLEISDCGSIQSLPNRGLPSSVQVVSINNCRLLARSCMNEGIVDHAKAKGILVWIDGCEVSASAD
ncbi:unnamed protein product [Urochloa decumbens]|uniref:Uncharacterized protein n=1 Tax=Urochloa decumbens TaxID=240449 RepID=A0ABC8WZ82_9POAL